MDREFIHGRMVGSTRVATDRTRSTDLVHTPGLMGKSTSDSGVTAKDMAKVDSC